MICGGGVWEQYSIASIILYDEEKDNLIDGQHRLAAVVESGVTIGFLVYLVNANNKINFIDRGKTRTVSDLMTFQGYDNDVANSAIVAVSKYYYEAFASNGKNKYCSDGDAIKFTIDNQEVLKKAKKLTYKGSSSLTRSAPIIFAAFCALKAGVSYDDLDHFFDVVNSGFANGSKDSSAVVLRKELQDLKGKNNLSQRVRRTEFADMAIYDYVNNKERKQKYKTTRRIYVDLFCKNYTE